jgi:hypothetical protein
VYRPAGAPSVARVRALLTFAVFVAAGCLAARPLVAFTLLPAPVLAGAGPVVFLPIVVVVRFALAMVRSPLVGVGLGGADKI